MALKNQPSPKPALSSKVLVYGVSSFIAISAIILGVMGIEGIEETEVSQSFSNVAISGSGNAGTDIAISTNSDGGFAWGDINNDGCLDLVVNTYTKSPGTRILISDCDATDPSFSDETTTICPGCESSSRADDVERSANLVDVNHDGEIDLIINGNALVEVYLNSGAPTYQFGTADFSITSITGGMNVEGLFVVDYDNDGWLDLILENHNYGIDIFENPGDGTVNFSYVDPTSIGLPTSATDGDYGSALDFDDDGDVDIVARKKNQSDFYINGGNGTFTTGVNIDDADNGNKGGVVLADFDNDGDYDLYWTDNGVNQIWRNDAGTLVATASTGDGEPWASAGITAPTSGIDGCAVGDVNNDGKVDLFLTNDTGAGYLFLNQTTNGGSLSFIQDNLSINVNRNGEGCSFGDYDNDGDLDLYVVTKSGGNQLWRNSLNDDNYLFVEPRIDLGGGISRAALGANVIIKDCEGNIISGIREVATGSGHGTDAPDRVHFGLPSGPDELYNVVVKFLTSDGERVEVEKQINPSLVTNRILYIYDTDDNAIGRCRDFDQDESFDRFDLDDDNDGIPDLHEIYRGDHDGDGTLDFEDADFCSSIFTAAGWNCANGLPDPSDDLDADGILNFADADFYGCGTLVNGVCSTYDQDGDGLPDHKDLDSDNDGIPDLVEVGGIDTEGNGVVDGFSGGELIDTDDDGWYDLYDSFGGAYSSGSSIPVRDTDRDGVPDLFDLDSDNDGIPDVIEAGATDADGDGRADNFADSDNDGLHDHYDSTDSDPESENDATFSSMANTPLVITASDGDSDGIVDFSEGYIGMDADGDERLNPYDLDSDNDGLPDLIESGGVDTDGDGVVDDATASGSLSTDTDNDGYTDGLDPDLNNDGDVSDIGDTGKPLVISSTDSNSDGLPESYPAFNNDENGATTPYSADADGDNILNAYDLDADNDGLPDLVESGGIDSDGNGKVDGLDSGGLFSGSNDSDGDGFFDSYDPDDNTTSSDENSSSNPLVKTLATGSGVVDGHPAVADFSGNSGLANGRNIDFDQDGMPNFLDLDSDQDGITDVVESFGTRADATQDGQADNASSSDSNRDGWHDSFLNTSPTTADGVSEYSENNLPDYVSGIGEMDADSDGLPNYLDIDADGDGIVDLIEAQLSSTDMDNKFDGLDVASATDSDYDGLADEVDPDHSGTYIVPVNTDGEDQVDYLDSDSDNDGFGDNAEGHDEDMDGMVDNVADGTDSDLDGLDNGYDTETSYYNSWASNQSLPDTDGDIEEGGDRDWRDLDSSSLPVEWSGFEGEWKGGMVSLNWRTAMESNSDFFSVERSQDGRVFEQIGSVDAIGNASTETNYDFLDRNPGKPIGNQLFYRLRQVDINGTFDYSSTVVMSIEDAASAYLKVYPNPIADMATFEFTWDEAVDGEIIIYTMAGQEVFRQNVAQGTKEAQLNLSFLNSGSYVAVIIAGKERVQQRIEKR